MVEGFEMKIVIDARMLGWSGIGRYSRNLLSELQKQDKTNHYYVLLCEQDYRNWELATGKQKKLTPNSKLLVSIFRTSNWHPILSKYRPFSLGEQLGLAWQLYRLKPDLVHFLNYNAPCFYLKKRIVTIHDLTMLWWRNYYGGPLKRLVTWAKYWPMRFVLRCSVMRSARLITPTIYVKKEVLRHWGKDVFYQRLKSKIFVTYEAAEPIKSRPQAIKNLKKPYLLYVGNAYPHKNLGNLVEAFRMLQLVHKDLRLVLAGKQDSYYQKLAQQIKKEGIKNVRLLSPDDSELAWLYQNAVLLCLPSLSEGFGLTGLEAMGQGTPVAAARASSLPEVYGQAAAYFDPASPVDIAAQVEKLLANPAGLVRLSKAGRKQASNYSWGKMAEQTLAVYNSVIK